MYFVALNNCLLKKTKTFFYKDNICCYTNKITCRVLQKILAGSMSFAVLTKLFVEDKQIVSHGQRSLLFHIKLYCHFHKRNCKFT